MSLTAWVFSPVCQSVKKTFLRWMRSCPRSCRRRTQWGCCRRGCHRTLWRPQDWRTGPGDQDECWEDGSSNRDGRGICGRKKKSKAFYSVTHFKNWEYFRLSEIWRRKIKIINSRHFIPRQFTYLSPPTSKQMISFILTCSVNLAW